MHRALNSVMMGLALYAVVVPGIWYGFKERAEPATPVPPAEPPRGPAPQRPAPPPPGPTESEAPRPAEERSSEEPEEEPEPEPEKEGPIHEAHEAADHVFEELENLFKPR